MKEVIITSEPFPEGLEFDIWSIKRQIKALVEDADFSLKLQGNRANFVLAVSSSEVWESVEEQIEEILPVHIEDVHILTKNIICKLPVYE